MDKSLFVVKLNHSEAAEIGLLAFQISNLYDVDVREFIVGRWFDVESWLSQIASRMDTESLETSLAALENAGLNFGPRILRAELARRTQNCGEVTH